MMQTGWYCSRCKENHFNYCPKFWGRFNYYRQFMGEAHLIWVIKQAIKPSGQIQISNAPKTNLKDGRKK